MTLARRASATAASATREGVLTAEAHDAAQFSVVESLRDGRRVEIRALRPADRPGLLAAVGRSSPASRRLRFFTPKQLFSEQEIAGFVNIDFVRHVALVVVANENNTSTIIGGARYIVIEPGSAEVALALVDDYQGQGLGSALMRHLVALARRAGLKRLVAEVLPDNAAMLKVFEAAGLPLTKQRGRDAVHVTLELS